MTYVWTTAGQTVVDLLETKNNATNKRNNNKKTANQNNNSNNDGYFHQLMNAMTQILDSKSQMLADPNALLGPLTQHKEVSKSQLCKRLDLWLLDSSPEKEKDASEETKTMMWKKNLVCQ